MEHVEQARASQQERAPMVRVWDPIVRIFHWSLVVFYVVAFVSGDDLEDLHLIAGYTIAALVGARIVWGFIGPRHARFASFLTPPKQIVEFLKQSLHLSAPRYLGHNPAGGAMVMALLILMIGLAITGHLMTTETYWGSEALEEVHEVLANISLALVVLHIAGVIVASFEHRENLPRAMVTGLKRAPGPADID